MTPLELSQSIEALRHQVNTGPNELAADRTADAILHAAQMALLRIPSDTSPGGGPKSRAKSLLTEALTT